MIFRATDRCLWIFTVAVMGLPRATDAQATRPVGPAQVVAEFQRSMDGENPSAVSEILFADDPGHRAVIMEMQALADAMARLRQNIRTAFGSRAESLLASPAAPTSEKITGDSAIVVSADGKRVRLLKTQGHWRIPVKQNDGGHLASRIAELRNVTDGLNRIADETQTGRFDNPDELIRAVQEELMNPSPSTRPTTDK